MSRLRTIDKLINTGVIKDNYQLKEWKQGEQEAKQPILHYFYLSPSQYSKRIEVEADISEEARSRIIPTKENYADAKETHGKRLTLNRDI